MSTQLVNNIINGENQSMWSFRVTIEEGAEDAICTTKVVTSALCITTLLATKGSAGGQLTHLGGSLPCINAAKCRSLVGQPAGGAESLSSCSTSASKGLYGVILLQKAWN